MDPRITFDPDTRMFRCRFSDDGKPTMERSYTSLKYLTFETDMSFLFKYAEYNYMYKELFCSYEPRVLVRLLKHFSSQNMDVLHEIVFNSLFYTDSCVSAVTFYTDKDFLESVSEKTGSDFNNIICTARYSVNSICTTEEYTFFVVL